MWRNFENFWFYGPTEDHADAVVMILPSTSLARPKHFDVLKVSVLLDVRSHQNRLGLIESCKPREQSETVELTTLDQISELVANIVCRGDNPSGLLVYT